MSRCWRLLPLFALLAGCGHAPSPAVTDADAASRRPSKATQLAGFTDLKAALADGHPVAFGFIVTDAVMRVGPDGIMPLPAPGDSVRGGHAVLAVGYDDSRKLVIMRNSWGAEWGDHGYFYMPYSFVQDPSYMLELWTAE